MSATGIGAPVRRKEDLRFITGKGQYTDDINRPGQAYAVFVRSPHAHANIRRIDTAAAKSKPGCLAVFTGEDIAKGKVGNLFCGYASVVFAMRGDLSAAAVSIGYAIVLDMLDGRIARLTNTTSAFGVEFDSLKLYATYEGQPSAPRVMIDDLKLTPAR